MIKGGTHHRRRLFQLLILLAAYLTLESGPLLRTTKSTHSKHVLQIRERLKGVREKNYLETWGEEG